MQEGIREHLAPWTIALLVIGGAVALYIYDIPSQTPSQVASADEREEAAALLAKIGEIVDLPQDEFPTVATVSDTSLLPKEPFFANAKRGDRVLIYLKAGRAYLYDPEAHKLIESMSFTPGPVREEK